MRKSEAEQHLIEARKSLNTATPNTIDQATQDATTHALMSIAESLITMNTTFERMADE